MKNTNTKKQDERNKRILAANGLMTRLPKSPPSTVKELQAQNDLAAALLDKLEKIRDVFAELPSDGDLEVISKESERLAGHLEQARATFNASDFPSENTGLDDAQKSAAAIAGSLTAAAETYAAEDFPHPDTLDDLAKTVAAIAANLNEAVEKRSELAE